MKIEEYRKEVTRTIVILPTLDKNLLHMAYGITTEIGELQDIYKKELAYSKSIDLVNLKEEIGDIFWYIFNTLNFLEITEREIYDLKYGIPRAINFIKNEKLDNIKFLLPHLVLQNADIFTHILKYNRYILIREVVSLYYDLCSLCEIYKFDYEEIMEININKLRIRFPEKFTQDLALNRNLEEERKSLENNKNK